MTETLKENKTMEKNLTELLNELAEFTVTVDKDKFTDHLLQHAGYVISDIVSSIVYGTKSTECMNAFNEKFMTVQCNANCSTLFLEDIAFFCGLSGSHYEVDEGNYLSGGHPGINIIPVVIAFSALNCYSGRALAEAAILGYEVATRFGMSVRANKDIHPNGTWGIYGAVAVISRLLAFDIAQTRNIFFIASQLISINSNKAWLNGSTSRSAFAAVGCKMAFVAYSLTKNGFRGCEHCVNMVFNTIGKTNNSINATIDLGYRWYSYENFFKIGSSCRETQGSLTAFINIIKDNLKLRDESTRITKIVIETFRESAELYNTKPINALSARFSIPFVVSYYLIYGSTFYSDDEVITALSNADMILTMSKVDVKYNKKCSFKNRETKVKIIFDDNTQIKSKTYGAIGDYAYHLNSGDTHYMINSIKNILPNKVFLSMQSMYKDSNAVDLWSMCHSLISAEN